MMSIFRVPTNVVDRIDTLKRNFLWQGNCDTKKIHLIKWKSVIISKKISGMGIKNLTAQNHCLLMKWLWRFTSNEQSLWKKVITQKYDMDGKWITKAVTTPYRVRLWRSIRNLGAKFMSKCSHQVVDLVEVCHPNHCNIGLLSYSPLAGGTLSGKYLNSNSEASKKGRLNLFPGYMERYNKSLAKGHVLSKLQLLHVMSDHLPPAYHLPPAFLRPTSAPPEAIQR
ncbi:putative receptor-like cytosolic serine/threonine-protein kinase RBK2-like [Capsicum annuum]|nr:putative receptor-like cytosolic serine/threonine-protein kinase RBK2-like [Capsicum annuum]